MPSEFERQNIERVALMRAQADRYRDKADAAVYGVIIAFCFGPPFVLLLTWCGR